MANFTIRICTYEDIPILTGIIRKSFRDVAERFGLTDGNAPRHPSHCTDNWIKADMQRGVTYFAIENENKIAGCVACEQVGSKMCYLERLAVLPGKRNQGLGKALVEHVLSKARESGADCVSIGIIAEHIALKNWYSHLGFVETETKEFLHLPFLVTFMSYNLRDT